MLSYAVRRLFLSSATPEMVQIEATNGKAKQETRRGLPFDQPLAGWKQTMQARIELAGNEGMP